MPASEQAAADPHTKIIRIRSFRVHALIASPTSAHMPALLSRSASTFSLSNVPTLTAAGLWTPYWAYSLACSPTTWRKITPGPVSPRKRNFDLLSNGSGPSTKPRGINNSKASRQTLTGLVCPRKRANNNKRSVASGVGGLKGVR